MKSLIIASLSLFIINLTFGGEIENSMTMLKKQREEAIAKYAATLDKQYVVELQKLQKKAMDSKDLDAAVAVRNELSQYGVKAVSGASSTSSMSKEDIKKFLVKTKFRFSLKANQQTTFHENGKATGCGYFTAWKITGNKELTMTGWNGVVTLVFDMNDDWTSGKFNLKKSTKKDTQEGAVLSVWNESDGTEIVAPKEVPTQSSDPDNTAFGRKSSN